MKNILLPFALSALVLVGCSQNNDNYDNYEKFDSQVEAISDVLEESSAGSSEFDDAVAKLEHLTDQGCIECAMFLAEIYWSEPQYGSTEESYKWYWVDFSTRGYDVENFHYDGVVEGLLEQIGESKAGVMREEADSWLDQHSS